MAIYTELGSYVRSNKSYVSARVTLFQLRPEGTFLALSTPKYAEASRNITFPSNSIESRNGCSSSHLSSLAFEGFGRIEHQKPLHDDGYDRPDVQVAISSRCFLACHGGTPFGREHC